MIEWSSLNDQIVCLVFKKDKYHTNNKQQPEKIYSSSFMALFMLIF